MVYKSKLGVASAPIFVLSLRVYETEGYPYIDVEVHCEYKLGL